jgi:hypothetical protein
MLLISCNPLRHKGFSDCAEVHRDPAIPDAIVGESGQVGAYTQVTYVSE